MRRVQANPRAFGGRWLIAPPQTMAWRALWRAARRAQEGARKPAALSHTVLDWPLRNPYWESVSMGSASPPAARL